MLGRAFVNGVLPLPEGRARITFFCRTCRSQTARRLTATSVLRRVLLMRNNRPLSYAKPRIATDRSLISLMKNQRSGAQ